MSEPTKRKLRESSVFVLISALASITVIIGFVMTCGDRRSAAVEPCDDVIGQWDWLLTGGVVAVAAGGSATWRQASDASAPSVPGTWTCDRRTDEIEIRWATGFTDRLEMSDGGERLTGQNRQGDSISATRTR